jgi:hypothetical protein
MPKIARLRLSVKDLIAIVLGTHKLSGVVAHRLSGFIMPLGGRDETDGMAAGDGEDEV